MDNDDVPIAQVVYAARCVIAIIERTCPAGLRQDIEPIVVLFKKAAEGGPGAYDVCEEAFERYYHWQYIEKKFTFDHHFAAHQSGWVKLVEVPNGTLPSGPS